MAPTRVAMLNQKGGVAKTTTTLHLGGTLAASGHRVLLVDFDGQGNLTTALRIDRLTPGTDLTLTQAMLNADSLTPADVRGMIRHHSSGLHLLPSALDMFTLPRYLHSVRAAKEYCLARVLEHVEADYDYVLTDCRPALDVDTDNALLWSDEVIVPVDLDEFSIDALTLLVGQVSTLARQVRAPGPTYRGLVINRVARPLSGIEKRVWEAFEGMALPVLGAIPMRTALSRAKRKGLTIHQFAPSSDVAGLYRDLATKAGYMKETPA
ncbi:ParA family protein [Streptomyces sp. NPDC058279]|uniref:ParA family protein n=1 Tax=Streptomyces sp. NPDC058279 TaxID=3346418 RepID=UPI0036EF6131